VSQSRLGSFIEAMINIIIGFAINFTANALVFPLFGWHISTADNFLLGAIYTVISLVRSYTIRRWFNARIHRAASVIAGDAA
jgi:hypothetical protein